MLSKIRRAVSGMVEKPQENDWDLRPGEGLEPTLDFESPLEPLEPGPRIGTFDPYAGGDYAAGLLKASIADGGNYGDYRIPVWWLQAILADIEGRHEDSKLLWDRSEAVAGTFEDESEVGSDPAYGRLFGDPAAGADGAPGPAPS